MYFSRSDMLWTIGSLCQVFHIPFSPHLVSQQFPPPYSDVSLLNALRTLDFKVGEVKLGADAEVALKKLPFPVVAYVREEKTSVDGANHESGECEQPAMPALLVKVDAERVLFFRAGSDQPETICIVRIRALFPERRPAGGARVRERARAMPTRLKDCIRQLPGSASAGSFRS